MQHRRSPGAVARRTLTLLSALAIAACADTDGGNGPTAPNTVARILYPSIDPNAYCHLTGDYGGWYGASHPDAPNDPAESENSSGFRLLQTGCDVLANGFDDQLTSWRFANWIADPQAGAPRKVYGTYEYRFLNASGTLGGRRRIVTTALDFVQVTIDRWGLESDDPDYIGNQPFEPRGTKSLYTSPSFNLRLYPELAAISIIGFTAGCSSMTGDADSCWSTSFIGAHDEPVLCIANSDVIPQPGFDGAGQGFCIKPGPSLTTNELPRAAIAVSQVTSASAGSANGAIAVNGTGSGDPVDNDAISSYSWQLLNASHQPIPNATRSGASPTPFGGLAAGTYFVRLAIIDARGGLDVAEVSVTVPSIAVNRAPVAVASITSVQQPTKRSGSFTVSAAGSYDPDGDPITYEWTVRDAANAVVGTATTATATFYAFPGTYTATLVVRDASLPSAPDSETVTIQSPSPNVFIYGPSTVQPYSSCTYTATLNNSTESHTMMWYVSSGGGPFFQAETGSTYTHYAYPGSLTIRARAIRGDGSVIASADLPATVTTSASGC